MKKILLFLTALFTTIGYSQTVGDIFNENFITYQVTSITPNEVRIEDYDVNGGTIVDIPATVTNTGTVYNVTEIYQTSFFNKGLTSVTIPNTVTNIGDAAFITNNLNSVIIPNSVIAIGVSSFQNNLLTEIIIPNSVTNIGQSAFKNNPLVMVSSVATAPPAITTGGGGDSFNSDRSGINLTIPIGTTAAYTAATWIGFNSVTEVSPMAVGDTFVVDFITYEVTSVSPETVEAIDYNTAGGSVVNIPTLVTNSSIAFEVTTIGDNAFLNKQLTSVFIPNSIVSIGYQSFRNCYLTSIVIPGSVTIIGNGAFTANLDLANVTIEDGVLTISNSAFFYCGLTSVDIPNSVITIGSQAFDSNDLASVTLGDNVEVISYGAFINNQITTITFPSSITTIENLAFHNNLLTDVYSESLTPPAIFTGTTGVSDTFDNRSNIQLHIPTGTMGAFVTNAGALWTGFNPVTEDALGTSNFELENDIKVITTSNQLEISYSNNVSLEKYTIYSMTGAKVKEGTETTIAIEELSNGIYILKLDFDKGTAVRKIAK